MAKETEAERRAWWEKQPSVVVQEAAWALSPSDPLVKVLVEILEGRSNAS